MPAQWTADLIGKMHLAKVTAKELAAEAGWHPKYLSAVLNGHKEPKRAEETLCKALIRLEIKREMQTRGRSGDLDALVASYRRLCPAYARELEELITPAPASSA